MADASAPKLALLSRVKNTDNLLHGFPPRLLHPNSIRDGRPHRVLRDQMKYDTPRHPLRNGGYLGASPSGCPRKRKRQIPVRRGKPSHDRPLRSLPGQRLSADIFLELRLR